MKRTTLTLVLTALLGSQAVLAGQFYIGANVGRSEFKVTAPGVSTVDSDDTAYKLLGGYNFNRVLSVELNLVQYGSFREELPDGEFYADAQALTAYAVGIIPIGPKFDLYAKAGFASWRADVQIVEDDVTTTSRPDGVDFAWGFGAVYHSRKHWSIVLEWELTEAGDLDRLNVGTVGFRWEF